MDKWVRFCFVLMMLIYFQFSQNMSITYWAFSEKLGSLLFKCCELLHKRRYCHDFIIYIYTQLFDSSFTQTVGCRSKNVFFFILWWIPSKIDLLNRLMTILVCYIIYLLFKNTPNAWEKCSRVSLTQVL